MELQQKIETNTWDHIDDVLRVLQLARAGKWSWFGNTRCKYIDVRIDMRDGCCVLKDREGKRIDLATLSKQAMPDDYGLPWPTPDKDA